VQARRGGLLFVVAGIVLTLGASPQKPTEVLIIQDELPQMKVLAGFLQEKGHLSVAISDQASLPKDLSVYRAVLVSIHRDLQETTEKAIIDYTQKGGKLVCLHHSISSARAANKFYFGFLGVQLDKGPMAARRSFCAALCTRTRRRTALTCRIGVPGSRSRVRESSSILCRDMLYRTSRRMAFSR
jgi:hypothetical protein